ncbi:hypothetical protein LZ30DRAFT_272702 [Colletotrichum cereale]|nr:hypothetical protein LZ30DRAFT_272702 [Colletotrichum cereale]
MKASYALSILLAAAAQVEAKTWWCQCRAVINVPGRSYPVDRSYPSETKEACRSRAGYPAGQMWGEDWCKVNINHRGGWKIAWTPRCLGGYGHCVNSQP